MAMKQRRMGDQIPTHVTTIEEIMSSHTFALSVADVRAGRPVHRDYDKWHTNDQWNYERGQCWARLTPRHILLKRNGKITREAIRYERPRV
jgi:hypothetical protein